MIIAGLDLSPNSSGLTKFELDNELNVIKSEYMGFTTVKKNSCENIHYYNPKHFNNYLDKVVWMKGKIQTFINDCSFIAIEDYAFSSVGKVFNIAEFAGIIKEMAYNLLISIRLYDPNSIKIFATDKGNCDKLSMYDAFEKLSVPYKHSMTHLPEVNKGNGVSPTSDIIDSFFICELLLLELKLRKGLVYLKNYPEKVIKVMNRTTKSNPVNILAQDFIVKGYLNEFV